ncbi:MAG: deaminase [Patescibacteria group bacterium]
MPENREQTIKYMQIACKQCDKSHCGWKIGAVAVKQGKALAKSFNETLKGEKYCQDGQCYRKKYNLSGGKEIEKVCSIHAEQNIIASCAKKGISLNNATLYINVFPCYICAKSLIIAGFKKVYYMQDYAGNEASTLFKSNNVILEKVEEGEVWSQKL